MTEARFGQTPWQTVGPFFHYALPWRGAADLVSGQGELGARLDLIPEGHYFLGPAGAARAEPHGEVVEVAGRVLDGDGEPVADALLEIWQADAHGRYGGEADPDFIGFGRASTGADGGFRFRTIRPGPVPGPGGALQAPHIALGVLGRGLLKRLVTRIYFETEPADGGDPILALVPEARRRTLFARRDGDVWRFDVRLQGPGETVFFEF